MHKSTVSRAVSALEAPLQRAPNLALAPGVELQIRADDTSQRGTRVLELLAEGDTAVHDLLDAIAIEPSNLSQQLAVLRKAGLVESQRGAHGGYRLGRPAKEIQMLDVVQALEAVSVVHDERVRGPGDLLEILAGQRRVRGRDVCPGQRYRGRAGAGGPTMTPESSGRKWTRISES